MNIGPLGFDAPSGWNLVVAVPVGFTLLLVSDEQHRARVAAAAARVVAAHAEAIERLDH